MYKDDSYIIGIAGGSGSGKTTVIRKMLDAVKDDSTVIFQHDWYYKHNSHLSFEQRSGLNYDHPNSLETSLLITHLKEILEGKTVSAPQYDFSQHLRTSETKKIGPKKIILIDGILIFDDENLRNLMDLKIFVDTDSDLRFIRRMERDIIERGRTRELVVNQYLSTVKPMHDHFVEPSKRHADVIIPSDGENSVAVDLVIAKMRSLIGDKTIITEG